MEMEDYGMEMEGEEDGMMDMEEGQMMDGYPEEDESINFDDNPEYANMPPLDKMRKIRRNIFKTINELREAHKSPAVYHDVNANKAAAEYASYLLTDNEDAAKVEEICKKWAVVGTVQPLVGFAILEEDEDHQGTLHDNFMDAHGLLLELEYEAGVLADPKNTHIGIGFAYNKEQVKVVEFVSQKHLMVHSLAETDDGGVEANGVLLNKEVGLYAARVVSLQQQSQVRKGTICGLPEFKYQKSSGEFTLTVPGPVENAFYCHDDPKVIEFYVNPKRAAEKLEYGVASNEQINLAHLELSLQLPMEFIPDPRTVIEDAADIEREQRAREMRQQRAEQEAAMKQAEKVARQAEKEKLKQALQEQRANRPPSEDEEEGDMSGRQGGSQGSAGEGSDEEGQQMSGSEDDYGGDEDSEDSDDIAELPSQNEMKKDLIQAIEEELREQETLQRENMELQKQIITMDSNFDQYDKAPDVQMNEHKYLNTLANVHQVRINLKETQDRYNKMASELQHKLNEKQAKCHEIEQQFKELKRSVAQNAVFSRTGKKIPKKTLDEWEESESLKDQEVHQYRLQNIALRNKLANKEKILKKKEQLADGLHLIDFEQLKIENQTLNEKIEERNEELHKLKKKITCTVVILSHTREKLQYVQEQNRIQALKLADLNEQLNNEKNEQSKLKKQKERLQKTNQKLKQQTGIVQKPELRENFNQRDKEIAQLQEKIKVLQVKHMQLQRIIEQANEIQMKKMGN